MKKFLKAIIILPITIILLFVIIAVINVEFGGYSFETDIDCINNYVGHNLQVKDIVYKYENDDKEIFLYNSNNGDFFNCILDKKTKKDKILYRINKNGNTPPITWYKEWNEVNKNLKYIFVDFEDDIENIDCGGYTPIGTRINYQLGNGEKESCWIYIIDKTKKR